MTTAMDDNDFESSRYLPEIMTDNTPSINAERMEAFMRGTLDSRVVHVSTKGYKSVDIIDQTIRVRVPSDDFRAGKVSHWKEEHGVSKNWAWIEGGMAALFGVGTAVAIACGAPFLMTALGVCAVGSMFFSGKNIYKTQEATRQMEGWSISPIEQIAHERSKAYQEGFVYVYNNDLKLENASNKAVLLPYEVHFLFDRYFNNFCQRLLSQDPRTEKGQKEWLDHFTSYNPVSVSLLRYGNDDQIPAKYFVLSNDYETVRKALGEIRDYFGNLRSERCEETRKIKQTIENNRQLALAPFILARDYYIQDAKNRCDIELGKTTDLDAQQNIKKLYQAEVEKYETYYAVATIPVHLVFNKQISDASDNLNQILKEIERNAASAHAPYYNYARGLLQHAHHVHTAQEYVYPSQPFVAAQTYNIPMPSAPPVVQINFFQQAIEQKPQGINDSNYADYLRFLQYQQNSQAAG